MWCKKNNKKKNDVVVSYVIYYLKHYCFILSGHEIAYIFMIQKFFPVVRYISHICV